MVKYRLFQVKPNLTREFGFMRLESMEVNGIELNLDNYDLVYKGDIDDSPNVLENLFRIFNLEHPEDFHGRSMSVSDIVKIGGDYYYCDSFGWKNVNDLLKY